MAAIVGLLVLAASCIFVGPRVLATVRWRLRYPRAALTLWMCIFLAGLAGLLGSLGWSLILAVGERMSRGAGLHGAWLGPMAVVMFGWAALAVTGALVGLVFTRAEPLSGESRRTREQLDLLAESTAYRFRFVRGVEVVFIRSDLPYAISFPGANRRVLITSRLEDDLSAAQLRAVVEHERAHLIGHHGLITQLAQLNRACVPRFGGAREFERTARLLVELIADDAAARACGGVHAANALLRLGRVQSDDSMLLRASRLATHPPRKSVRFRTAAPAEKGWLNKPLS